MAAEVSCSCAVLHRVWSVQLCFQMPSCVQSALLFALVITESINAVLLTQSNLAFEAVYFVISRGVFNVVSSFVLAGHTKDSVQ